MDSSRSPLLLVCKEKQPQQPHAILFPLPAQGHVIPFLNLARLLASKGIAVSFVCAEHRISLLRTDQSLLTNPLIHLVGLPERVPPRESDTDEVYDSFIWLFDVADSMKDDFVKFVKLHRSTAAATDVFTHPNYGAPDCIIADPFLSWINNVASNLSIPLYTFYTSPCWSLTTSFYIPILTSEAVLPLRSSAQPQLMSFPGLPPLWDTDLFHFVRDVVPARLRNGLLNFGLVLSQSSRILLNTTYEIESGNIDALENEDPYKTNFKIQPIGPLLPSELLDKDHVQHSLQSKPETSEVRDCLEWLNTQSPASVLYVSFGSIYVPSDDEIIEIAHGLEASTHNFLWVLRPPPCDNSQNEHSWLSRVLPPGFQSRTHSRGFILPHWAPQLLILSSPSIGGFFTHCGWNSILESICCGVPLLAYPRFAEQRLNCRMIVDQLKLGIELETNELEGLPERNAVERAVRSVMEGEESQKIRREVRESRKRMKTAVKENGSSNRNVEAIVQEIFHFFDHKLDNANINIWPHGKTK
ncbi:hypothetical protein O6H91_Y133900 [Diphasiastrum complanatum]|nr:hypothetical protein O6H91_Y133900 [Diphasiastrum complanatum]